MNTGKNGLHQIIRQYPSLKNCLFFSHRTNMYSVIHEMEQQKIQSDEFSQLQKLIYYDYLTQLPNRRFLQIALNQIMQNCQTHQTLAALLFIDLDNFKEINDAYGHAMGDMLLQKFSARLSSIIRFEDIIVRYSGDEFIIILDALGQDINPAQKNVETITRKILNSLIQPFDLHSNLYYCSISIGITLFGCNPISMEEIIHSSDLAMYSAKIAGKNTYHIHDKIH